MKRIFKNYKGAWVTVLVILLAIPAMVAAEYIFDPQYANKGKLGTSSKPWGEGNIRDLNVSRNLDFDTAGGVSRFRTNVYRVTSYTQLSLTTGGASIFVIDPGTCEASRIEVDLTAINASASPYYVSALTGWALSGLTVAPVTPTGENNGYIYTVVKPDSSTTPIWNWQPTESNTGVTPEGTLNAFNGCNYWLKAAYTTINNQGDSKTFRLQYNSEVSVQQINEQIEPKIKNITFADLTTWPGQASISGQSIFKINPLDGNIFRIDPYALIQGDGAPGGTTAFPITTDFTGVTIVGPDSDTYPDYEFKVEVSITGATGFVHLQSGATTVYIVPYPGSGATAYNAEGTTEPQSILYVYSTIGTTGTYDVLSGGSDWELDRPGESKTFRCQPNSAVSLYPVARQVFN